MRIAKFHSRDRLTTSTYHLNTTRWHKQIEDSAIDSQMAEDSIVNKKGEVALEGCKKALSAMSAGFPCVAVTGIWNGVNANRDENGKTESYNLIPTLKHLSNCKIYIAFDRDQASKTIKNVIQARSVLAKALIAWRVTAPLPPSKLSSSQSFLKTTTSSQIEDINR